MTAPVPDFREYSQENDIEAAAEKIKAQGARSKAQGKRTAEQLAAEVARIEAYEDRPLFDNPVTRYQWCMDEMAAGKALSAEDQAFCAEQEVSMSPETRLYWETYKESISASRTEAI